MYGAPAVAITFILPITKLFRVVKCRLPSQQAYAAACNVFDNSQTGTITLTRMRPSYPRYDYSVPSLSFRSPLPLSLIMYHKAPVLITTSLSAPDSAPHISPGRPRI